MTVDGKIIAMPTELQTYVVFANKKLIEASGAQVPTGDSMTYDEFQSLAKATTKSGQYGVSWGLKSPTATFMSMALNSGGTFFEGTGKDAKPPVGDAELALPRLVKTMT